jgi:septum formation protein
VPFEAHPADVAELTAGEPRAVAVENARRKALAIAGSAPADAVVLGVDTIVVLDGALYGKPADEAAARATLGALSGRVHEVLSGICVVDAAGSRTAAATTRVRFRPLDPATLDWYLASGEWRERAGAYAIQGRGAALVDAIDGDYLNVVGLPVAALLELLPDILQRTS